MNPQNVGPHIDHRHSLLWKKPLKYQKPESKPKPLCHLQMNPMGATGHSWRTRNNAITFGRQSSRPKTAHTSKLRPTEFNQLVPLSELDQKSQRLNQTMRSESNVQNNLTVAAYPAVGCLPFVINDYHSKLVNPSFSRNEKGKHFSK